MGAARLDEIDGCTTVRSLVGCAMLYLIRNDTPGHAVTAKGLYAVAAAEGLHEKLYDATAEGLRETLERPQQL